MHFAAGRCRGRGLRGAVCVEGVPQVEGHEAGGPGKDLVQDGGVDGPAKRVVGPDRVA